MSHSLKPFGIEIQGPSKSIANLMTASQLQALVLKEKLVVIRGLEPMERGSFLEFARSFENRSILEWNFGPVMELKEVPKAANYIFSSEGVPYHWDGAFATVPSFLLFSCIEAPSTEAGGETLFCDTEAIYESASAEERDLFARATLRFETEKLAHYGGVAEGPLVRKHPETGRTILRYSEPVETKLNPVSLTVKGVTSDEADRLKATLQSRLYDSRYVYAHKWQPGDFVIADNHSLLHGRRPFQSGSGRLIRRIQLV